MAYIINIKEPSGMMKMMKTIRNNYKCIIINSYFYGWPIGKKMIELSTQQKQGTLYD